MNRAAILSVLLLSACPDQQSAITNAQALGACQVELAHCKGQSGAKPPAVPVTPAAPKPPTRPATESCDALKKAQAVQWRNVLRVWCMDFVTWAQRYEDIPLNDLVTMLHGAIPLRRDGFCNYLPKSSPLIVASLTAMRRMAHLASMLNPSEQPEPVLDIGITEQDFLVPSTKACIAKYHDYYQRANRALIEFRQRIKRHIDRCRRVHKVTFPAWVQTYHPM